MPATRAVRSPSFRSDHDREPSDRSRPVLASRRLLAMTQTHKIVQNSPSCQVSGNDPRIQNH